MSVAPLVNRPRNDFGAVWVNQEVLSYTPATAETRVKPAHQTDTRLIQEFYEFPANQGASIVAELVIEAPGIRAFRPQEISSRERTLAELDS